MSNLEWTALKELKCPKCYKDLVRNTYGSYNCEDINCTFGISEAKMRDIVEPMFLNPEDPFGRADFEDLVKASKNENS